MCTSGVRKFVNIVVLHDYFSKVFDSIINNYEQLQVSTPVGMILAIHSIHTFSSFRYLFKHVTIFFGLLLGQANFASWLVFKIVAKWRHFIEMTVQAFFNLVSYCSF